jgi:hypothetical protein
MEDEAERPGELLKGIVEVQVSDTTGNDKKYNSWLNKNNLNNKCFVNEK